MMDSNFTQEEEKTIQNQFKKLNESNFEDEESLIKLQTMHKRETYEKRAGEQVMKRLQEDDDIKLLEEKLITLSGLNTG